MLLKIYCSIAIEYHWFCIKTLKKQLLKNKCNKMQVCGKINFHKFKASNLSYQYEILSGLRNAQGNFIS